jgi:hypothetical protein
MLIRDLEIMKVCFKHMKNYLRSMKAPVMVLEKDVLYSLHLSKTIGVVFDKLESKELLVLRGLDLRESCFALSQLIGRLCALYQKILGVVNELIIDSLILSGQCTAHWYNKSQHLSLRVDIPIYSFHVYCVKEDVF